MNGPLSQVGKLSICPLWSHEDAEVATGGQSTAPWSCSGVAIDNRELEQGDLFVALKGERLDGHQFVAKAFEAGASAALVAQDTPVNDDLGPLLRVKDTTAALVDLGCASRARSQAKVVGVTGSVGKTGTKDALGRCLSRQGATHVSVKSFNNEIGVPLTLARMASWAEFGVFEMGMNHAGELAQLTRQVRPHVALVTTVATAHKAHFSCEEAIADAKAEIFQGVEKGGLAVLNRDNPHFNRLKHAAYDAGVDHIISFGSDERADVRVLNVAAHDELSCISADVCGDRLMYKVGIPGQHWVSNSLGILAVVSALGADISLAALALGELRAGPGRGQRVRIKTRDGLACVIDDSYNANPASMRASLQTLGTAHVAGRGQRIAVLGDMLELGADADEEHAKLAQAISDANIDQLLCIGTHMKALEAALGRRSDVHHFGSIDELLDYARQQFHRHDLILVKGSNALGLGGFVSRLKAGEHMKIRPFTTQGEG